MPAGVSVSAHWRIRDGGDVGGHEKVGGGVVFDARLREERARFAVRTTQGHAAVFGVDVDAD
jgi:hypothetical protein